MNTESLVPSPTQLITIFTLSEVVPSVYRHSVHPYVLHSWLNAGLLAASQKASSTFWPSFRWQVTVLVCVPPPQVAEHWLQSPVAHPYDHNGFQTPSMPIWAFLSLRHVFMMPTCPCRTSCQCSDRPILRGMVQASAAVACRDVRVRDLPHASNSSRMASSSAFAVTVLTRVSQFHCSPLTRATAIL